MRILLPGNVRVQIPHYLRYSKVETSVCTVLTLVWRINTTNKQETTFVIRCSVDRIVYNGTNIINGYTRFVCVVNIKATTINIVNRSPFTISLFTICICVCLLVVCIQCDESMACHFNRSCNELSVNDYYFLS